MKKYEVSKKILKEIRCWDMKGVSLRVIRKEDGALPKIEGYAAIFNSDSEDMGFIERILPGAFTKALKKSDVRALFNHDPNIILGRVSAGTLELKEDETGLFMTITPPDTQLVRDMVLSPIERGDITQQSFGFIIESDKWENLSEKDNKPIVRTVVEFKELFDVSPVTYPAYQDTSVALRSLAMVRNQPDKRITVEVDGINHTFNSHEEFDLMVEKINELRKSDTSLSTAVLWEKKKAKPTLPANNDNNDKTLKRLKTAGRKLKI